MLNIYKCRAAGDVTISRPDANGVLQVVEVRKAGVLETARLDVESKRGPKPGSKRPDANKFAESANDF